MNNNIPLDQNTETRKTTKTTTTPNNGSENSDTTTKSKDISNSSSNAYKEMNCMFVISFVEILATLEFNCDFDGIRFDLVQALK